MDALKFVEERGGRALEIVRKGYDDLHERAYKLATLLLAGGGAMAAYALGRIGVVAALVEWLPIAVLALFWLVAAARLVWGGATSQDVPYGVSPGKLLGYYDGWIAAAKAPEDALERLRREDVRLEDERIRAYADACIRRAEAIDRTYKLAAVTAPSLAAIAAAACVALPLVVGRLAGG